ncbi:FAD-binding oxidoreductase [Rathayibacter sp. VKM Ac-2856]|uniref:NAD(P)/FAD-dependent oxidoreductase n=1 Tax=unclassified Rathayibacter TaxID=2609250 RepID=UPI001563E32F|nr:MULTISPECIES: FAD-binding oxidoreductase [unclassified Rathayibacter]NQX04837.1 FAD-binding oxidoreductase [Rathayibacter sp. VKM Ac-2858]NQX20005.1 FAD-binding oxidoreductase [Rathayibacter sp. VKM Ac-2856]
MSRDVVVVGAGLFGAATALHLARAGARVTLVESGDAARGTTAAGAGFVGLWAAGYAWYWNESERDLEQYGLDFYRALAVDPDRGGDIHLRDTGSAWLAVTEDGVRDHLGPLAEHPLRPEGSRELSPQQAAELIPGLDAFAVAGGFVQPRGLQISAPDAALALIDVARAAGVEILEHAPVTEVLATDGRASGVRVADGRTVTGDSVVLAAGSWTNELLAPLGRRLPLARVVASRLTTAPFGLPPLPTLMLPELGGLWIREHLGGLTYGNGVGYEPLGEAAADRRPQRTDLIEAMDAHLAPLIARLLPASADALRDTEWTQGVVSYTADRRFLAGPVPELPGLFVAAGDNESGVTHGPGLGRLVAELVLQGSTTLGDAERYAPGRFAPQAFADEAAVRAAMPARRLVDAVGAR